MEVILVGVVIFAVVCFIDSLQSSILFRAKVRKILGWVTILAWGILGGSIALLQYVGVGITYVCVPTGLISSGLWLYLWKHRDTVYADKPKT